MQTRCPYPDCSQLWLYDEITTVDQRSSNGFFRGRCAVCERPATIKPIEVWQQLDRKVVYLSGKDCLRGGPAPDVETINGSGPSVSAMSVLLDDIRSLHNVGSVFRTSDAFGFAQIYLCGITGTPDRHNVKKTSLSAETSVSWQYHVSGLESIALVKAQGGIIVSLERNAQSQDISELNPGLLSGKPLCLVLGNEVSGVSEELLAASDIVCHIPMHGIKESLNVSVAFGVAAFCLSKGLRLLG